MNSEKVIALPCKEGDTVWFDTYDQGIHLGIKPHVIKRIDTSLVFESEDGLLTTYIPIEEINKGVFLSEEEALLAKNRKIAKSLKGR